MKILVIGGGGREHAIVWKLVRSASVEKVWCAPGNAGIASDVECMPLDVKDPKAAADLAAKLGADLTIVGPELPLVPGIADEFARRGLALLGPTKAARGSKAARFSRRSSCSGTEFRPRAYTALANSMQEAHLALADESGRS